MGPVANATRRAERLVCWHTSRQKNCAAFLSRLCALLDDRLSSEREQRPRALAHACALWLTCAARARPGHGGGRGGLDQRR